MRKFLNDYRLQNRIKSFKNTLLQNMNTTTLYKDGFYKTIIKKSAMANL